MHEPLVSREVFEKAQTEMARRRDAKGQARPTRRYLLPGLLKCTHCGLNLCGSVLKLYPKGLRRGYYVDAGYRRCGPRVCKSTSIQAEALGRWVLGKVREIILNDGEATTANEDNPSGPVTASGFIHFAFQPIPEPATVTLFAFVLIATRRTRRRSSPP